MAAEDLSSVPPARVNTAGLPGWFPSLALGLVLAVALVVLYWDGMDYMTRKWKAPEYNHAYLIPIVAVYLLWLRAKTLHLLRPPGAWSGLGVLLVALLLLFVGNRSAIFQITQYGFVVAIWALVLAAVGWGGVRLLWVALVYMLFMVPLPQFLEDSLTAEMMLISSRLGVAVMRLAGISVFLEGNVIDLGDYKLQVAEACSGMRYLFPLMSFGFLCAALYHGPFWHRAVMFLMTIPMTIVMNSIRVGVIGLLVNFWGIEQAEGFIHYFEGWVVFMLCVAILFGVVWLFARSQGKRFLEVFGLEVPPVQDLVRLFDGARIGRPLAAASTIVVVLAAVSILAPPPEIRVPDQRPAFAGFPMRIGDFQGREVPIDQIYLDVLRSSDHLMAQFSRAGEEWPTELWIAYYDSQASGAAVHSPRACLPGGGWSVDQFQRTSIPDVRADGSPLPVNRALISLGDQRQLVYYWFAQRGRVVTNEYLVKWYILLDGLRLNRTDGALVRVATPVGDLANLPAAEARLQEFVRTLDPRLSYFLPDERAPTRIASPRVAAATP